MSEDAVRKKFVIVADWEFFIRIFGWFLVNYLVALASYLINPDMILMTYVVLVTGFVTFMFLQPFGTFWFYNKIDEEDIGSFFTGRN